MRKLVIAVAVLGFFAVASGQDRKQVDRSVVSLADAPANAWAKIVHSLTGNRDQPIFVYVPSVKKFVFAGGRQCGGGTPPRHYDTEEFDLASLKWVNAYPADVAGDRPESGPVGDEYSRKLAPIGSHGFTLFYKDGEHSRLVCGGQWAEAKAGYEFCVVPDTGKVYAYNHDKTVCYDPAKRTWEDLKATPRTSNRLWGALVYDPVNKEIVHACGDGGSLDQATWVYSIEKNEWSKLPAGQNEQSKLHDKAVELVWQAKELLGRTVNRFTVAETEAEAKADLKAAAMELSGAAAAFGEELAKSAKDKEWAAMAAGFVAAASGNVKDASGKLAEKITPETIAAVRAARVQLEQAADALAVIPPGRARSQIAYDSANKKIVMFGGDNLDRTLSDTWVYDCATRTWQQKFPKVCPRPRAGHILAFLPKAKKIVMAGGYSRSRLPQEIWSYDTAANDWKMLFTAEQGKTPAPAPGVNARTLQNGAVNDDDVLVCVDSTGAGLITWACKLDPSKTIDLAEGAAGSPLAYDFNRMDPADWEKVASPDAEKMKQFYADLPANQWTSVPFAKYAPGATNRWGTTAYDIDRHQFLFWSGGHATSHENDVAHFSVLGGCWTLGYHPDDPIEIVYASQPTPFSFHDRAHLPVHTYKSYCYDATAGKMFYFDRAYDPAAREWEARAYPGLEHRGVMHSHLSPTPAGAVAFSSKGLFRFDAKAGQWVGLPWTGPKPEGIWCDGDGIVYDPKRQCLWIGAKQNMYRYNLADGKGEKAAVVVPKSLGGVFNREQVYLPDEDLVLLMRTVTRADGSVANVVWDPNDLKYYSAAVKFVENGKEVKMPLSSWHDAIAYDAALKFLLINNSSQRKVWVMRFDRKAAKLEEIKE